MGRPCEIFQKNGGAGIDVGLGAEAAFECDLVFLKCGDGSEKKRWVRNCKSSIQKRGGRGKVLVSNHGASLSFLSSPSPLGTNFAEVRNTFLFHHIYSIDMSSSKLFMVSFFAVSVDGDL